MFFLINEMKKKSEIWNNFLLTYAGIRSIPKVRRKSEYILVVGIRNRHSQTFFFKYFVSIQFTVFLTYFAYQFMAAAGMKIVRVHILRTRKSRAQAIRVAARRQIFSD